MILILMFMDRAIVLRERFLVLIKRATKFNRSFDKIVGHASIYFLLNYVKQI